MKLFSPARLAYRQSRTGVSCHGLIWITAKSRDTGAPESIGLWTGVDHQTFVINGVGRTYFGAGNLLDLGDNVAEVGIKVRTRAVKLAAVTPEVKQAIKVYDARLARTEIHRVEFDTATNEQIDDPERVFKGWIDTIAWGRAGSNGEANCTLNLVSVARALTKALALKYSDACQRLRNAGDGLFKYTDVTTSADVWWGSKRVAGTAVKVVNSVFVRAFGKVSR